MRGEKEKTREETKRQRERVNTRRNREIERKRNSDKSFGTEKTDTHSFLKVSGVRQEKYSFLCPGERLLAIMSHSRRLPECPYHPPPAAERVQRRWGDHPKAHQEPSGAAISGSGEGICGRRSRFGTARHWEHTGRGLVRAFCCERILSGLVYN
jgi:hypothetical protein